MNKKEIDLEANGLRMIELGSRPSPVNEVDSKDLESGISDAIRERSYVVAWLDHKVLIGLREDERFDFYRQEEFDAKYIRRMRIFNTKQELLIWRTRGGFHTRLREDDMDGAGVHAVVAEQALFGTKKETLSDPRFTGISEERGTRLVLPFADLNVDNARARVFIKTHNYLDYNAAHQATYVDCRFVSFTDGHGDLS